MRVIPVLDLLNRVVVRGVAGQRSKYRPIESRLCSSPEPLAVARAFREHFGLTELYVADLDAIGSGKPPHASPLLPLPRGGRGKPEAAPSRSPLPPWERGKGEGAPAWAVYERLLADGFRLLVDAGVADPERGRRLAEAGVTVIAALETLAGPDVLDVLVEALGAERLVFSLDLKAGEPLAADLAAWLPAKNLSEKPGFREKPGFFAHATRIAQRALDAGVRRIIVLDLAGVGVGGGIPTLDLCRAIRRQGQTRMSAPPVLQSGEPRCVARTLRTAEKGNVVAPLEILSGGGVRGRDDLRHAAAAGVDGVLVASALHDGRLTRLDVAPQRAYY